MNAYEVKVRPVMMHRGENGPLVHHHDAHDIVRVSDGKIVRNGVCPSIVDAVCADLNNRAALAVLTDPPAFKEPQ